MSRSLRTNQAGTTLMELLVYLAISGVVILTMTTFVSALTKTRVETTNQQTAQDAARVVVERMTYAIRNAHSVNVTAQRMDVTSDSGIVTSFCNCGGTLKTGQQAGSAAPEANLESMIDASLTVETLTFEHISSSVRVSFGLSKAGQSANLTSTIAFRQNP